MENFTKNWDHLGDQEKRRLPFAKPRQVNTILQEMLRDGVREESRGLKY